VFESLKKRRRRAGEEEQSIAARMW
jgi:hypothetical protein